ncbi:bacteriocin [Kutzneria kofuensis]|uniref:Bacteriocin-like protein n=1 Tax=Kutzneria kofuensis TaxID=103725 RepID=A0A7W9KPS2_9PSEU|nr:bacteriocin [Kutzneria kofuensis]MBB5896503.1 bacteriocin-like protein [Kutzneria kofuensis]
MDNSEVLDIQELSDEMLAEIVGGSGLTINSCI